MPPSNGRGRALPVGGAPAGGSGGGRGPATLVLLFCVAAAAAALGLGMAGRSAGAGLASNPRARLAAVVGNAVSWAGSGSGNGSSSAALPAPPAQSQPQHKFLIFFSGHQGSSALADMLAAHPAVLIPGFEPLDFPGLTPRQKLAFMEAAFQWPASSSGAAGWAAWRAALEPLPGMRLDQARLRSPSQLVGKSVAGFKLRPYSFDGSSGGGEDEGQGGLGSRMHTALGGGLSAAAVRALLQRHNVSVVMMVRHNRLKEALSWYKARQLGISQFGPIRAARAAAKGAASAAATPGGSRSGGPLTAEEGGTNRQLGKQAAGLWQPAADGGMAAGMAGASGAAGIQAASNSSSGMLNVNITQLLGWLNFTDAVNKQLQVAAAFYDRPTITVLYEDFLADPMGQAQRVAAFLGVPADGGGAGGAGAPLRLSAKFKKAGPDAIQDWMANFGELCRALHGTEHEVHLDAAACAPHLQLQQGSISPGLSNTSGTSGAATQKSHSGSGSAKASRSSIPEATTRWTAANTGIHSGSGSSASSISAAANSSAMPGNPQLLDSWCVQKDKDATGWEVISDAECMRRVLARQEAAAAAVRNGSGTVLFKHVHKAGGSTLCKLARLNMVAESAPLPFRKDWDTNCAPFEAFLGPHPAVSGGTAAQRRLTMQQEGAATAAAAAGEGATRGHAAAGSDVYSKESSSGGGSGRGLAAFWLGGACWLGFATPAQLRALPHHFRPLTFVASEGPLPNAVPLDAPAAMLTMLRDPLDRTLSSYRWWQYMMKAMPQAPAECHAYSAAANATMEQWLEEYPDNWMTRELVGRTVLYQGRSRPLTEADLQTAKSRLHYFAAVLLLEQPRSSMALLRRVVGWREVGWEAHRAGSRRGSDAATELPAALLQQLQQSNEFDLRLYQYAEVLHEEQLRRAGELDGAVGSGGGGGSSGGKSEKGNT